MAANRCAWRDGKELAEGCHPGCFVARVRKLLSRFELGIVVTTNFCTRVRKALETGELQVAGSEVAGMCSDLEAHVDVEVRKGKDLL